MFVNLENKTKIEFLSVEQLAARNVPATSHHRYQVWTPERVRQKRAAAAQRVASDEPSATMAFAGDIDNT